MTQYIRPSGDIAIGSWLDNNDGSTTIYAAIDEATPDNNDYIYIAGTGASTFEASIGYDPEVSTDHILRYRVRRSVTNKNGTIDVRLLCGTTVICDIEHANPPDTWDAYSYTLTAGEADTITDYKSLRFVFDCTVRQGPPLELQASWIELTIPDREPDFFQTCTADLTLYDGVQVGMFYSKSPPSEVVTLYDTCGLNLTKVFVENIYIGGTDEFGHKGETGSISTYINVIRGTIWRSNKAGKIESIWTYFPSLNGTGNAKCALYEGVLAAADLLGETEERTLSGPSGWREFKMVDDVVINANTKYMMCCWAQSGAWTINAGYEQTGMGTESYAIHLSNTYGSWPDPFGPLNDVNYARSHYCTLISTEADLLKQWDINNTYSEVVTLYDESTRSSTAEGPYYQTCTADITLYDTRSDVWVASQTYSETIALEAEGTTKFDRFRTFNEVATLYDYISKTKAFTKTLSENITLYDTYSKSWNTTRTFEEYLPFVTVLGSSFGCDIENESNVHSIFANEASFTKFQSGPLSGNATEIQIWAKCKSGETRPIAAHIYDNSLNKVGVASTTTTISGSEYGWYTVTMNGEPIGANTWYHLAVLPFVADSSNSGALCDNLSGYNGFWHDTTVSAWPATLVKDEEIGADDCFSILCIYDTIADSLTLTKTFQRTFSENITLYDTISKQKTLTRTFEEVVPLYTQEASGFGNLSHTSSNYIDPGPMFSQFQMGPVDGEATTIRFYAATDAGTTSAQAHIYDSSFNKVGSASTDVTITTSVQLHTVTMNGEPLSADTNYYLAVYSSDENWTRLRYHISGGSGVWRDDYVGYPSWPEPLSKDATFDVDGRVAVYCDYLYNASSDTLSLEKHFYRTFSENITLYDTSSKTRQQTLSETVTLYDDVDNDLGELSQECGETISLYDTVTKRPAKTLTEALSCYDLVDTTTQWTRTYNENITLYDVDSYQWSITQTYNENITLYDTCTPETGLEKVLDETVVIYDDIAAQWDIVRIFTEDITLYDTVVKSVDTTLNENITLYDLDLYQWNVTQTFTEDITLYDDCTTEEQYIKTFSELVTLYDDLDTQWDITKILSEVVTLYDTLTPSEEYIKILSEDVTLYDTLDTMTTWLRAFSENVTLYDTYSRLWAVANELNENITIYDIFSTTEIYILSFDETITLYDLDSYQWNITRAFSETITLDDTYSRVWSLGREYSEVVTLYDFADTVGEGEKQLNEAIFIYDDYSDVWTLSREYTENITLYDTLTTSESYIKSLTEQTTIYDTISTQWNIVSAFDENITLYDVLTTTESYILEFSELVSIYDTVDRVISYSRTFSELVTLYDVYEKVGVFTRTFSENLTIYDTCTQDTGATKTLLETVNLYDTYSRILSLSREYSDTLTLYDTFTKSVSIEKELTETLTIYDTLSTSLTQGLILSEYVPISSTINNVGAYLRAFSDSITLYDTVNINQAVLKTYSELITIYDAITPTLITLEIELAETITLYDNVTRTDPYTRIYMRLVADHIGRLDIECW